MINSNKPPISIGISFYNAELTLLDAVRSIFAQTYQNWELILVDDGSTDNSLKVAQSITDPRVRVYSDGENRRLAARLNQLTQLAQYDFIARMDADDLVSPMRLEKQMELLCSQPAIDLVATGICSLSNDYKPVGIRCMADDHVITSLGLLSGASGIVHASLLGRREWFERNPYKESMLKSQDTNLWVRSYTKDDLRVAFIREPLYYYREDGNVTKNQLLLAYAMGRHTLLVDAKQGFSLAVKARVLADNLIKTLVVKFFTEYALKLARSRRNAEPLNPLQTESLSREISFIRSITLPLTGDKGEV